MPSTIDSILGLTSDEARHLWYPSEFATFGAPGQVIKVLGNFGFDESPFQSVITADLHAQLLDLPFVLLALGCALLFLLP